MAVASGVVLAIIGVADARWRPCCRVSPDPNVQDLELGADVTDAGIIRSAPTCSGAISSRGCCTAGACRSWWAWSRRWSRFLVGVSYGAMAGYFGGRTDNFMMRFVDVLYSLPYMFLVILLMVYFSAACGCCSRRWGSCSG